MTRLLQPLTAFCVFRVRDVKVPLSIDLHNPVRSFMCVSLVCVCLSVCLSVCLCKTYFLLAVLGYRIVFPVSLSAPTMSLSNPERICPHVFDLVSCCSFGFFYHRFYFVRICCLVLLLVFFVLFGAYSPCLPISLTSPRPQFFLTKLGTTFHRFLSSVIHTPAVSHQPLRVQG